MKKIFFSLVLFAFCFSLAFMMPVFAEDGVPEINWDDYTLEELLQIQESLSEKIAERQREYAIEHGDRTITLDETSFVLYIGRSIKPGAVVSKVVEDAPDETKLVWTSSDEAIAKVKADGTITGIATGDATITCSAEDNEFIFATAEVSVIAPVKKVSFPEANVEALIFENATDNGVQLSVEIAPEDAFCKDVTWSSSNEEIATVDENGYVKALAPGKVIITATSQDEFSASAPSAKCNVNVLQAASTIELDQNELVINMGGSAALNTSVLPENTSNKKVVWESANPEVATVSSAGQVKAVSLGNTVITCTAADGSGAQAECSVTVIQMVNSIKFTDVKSPITLNRGDTTQLLVEVLPEDATDQTVQWETSDDHIVSVSRTGVLSARNGGTAKITCTAMDGSEKQASIDVFVPSISVDKDTYTVKEKSGLSFSAKFYGESGSFSVTPSSTNYFTVNYNVSGEDVTIRISPIRAGTANITLKDATDSKNDRTVTIVIDHDAVYDTTSYPTLNYTDVMRNPDKYKGKKCSIRGEVLQIIEQTHWFSDDEYFARVGTSGWGNMDDVYYVEYDKDSLDMNIIDGDMVTVYGVCTGTFTYTATFGNKITVISMKAEKVIVG